MSDCHTCFGRKTITEYVDVSDGYTEKRIAASRAACWHCEGTGVEPVSIAVLSFRCDCSGETR